MLSPKFFITTVGGSQSWNFMTSLSKRTNSISINRSIGRTKAGRFLSSGITQDDLNRRNLNEDDGTRAYGYDVVLKKVAEIIKAVTDRQATKILHIHMKNNLVAHLGEKATGFDITGCSDNTMNSNEEELSFEGSEKYSKIEYLAFDDQKQLPFNGKTFQLVVNCTPADYTLQDSFNRIVWPMEVIRLIGSDGYGIIGFDQSMWETLNMAEQLWELDQSPSPLQLMSMQEVPYSSIAASRYIDSGSNSDTITVDEDVEIKDSAYWLALVRRKQMLESDGDNSEKYREGDRSVNYLCYGKDFGLIIITQY